MAAIENKTQDKNELANKPDDVSDLNQLSVDAPDNNFQDPVNAQAGTAEAMRRLKDKA